MIKHVRELSEVFRMSHYEKIAVVIIRAMGCCVAVYSLIGIPYNLVGLLLYGHETVIGLVSSFTYLIVGIALIALGKPLGALVVKGLPKD
jgi:hypothetical protein